MPAGEIDDPLALTGDELANLEARCVAACETHWNNDLGVSANCDDPSAFDLPEHFRDGPAGPYDLVPEAQKSGQGLFGSQSLACRLDSTCCADFDEDLCAAVPDRTTPANEPLGTGEEYRVALASSSKVEIVTNVGTYSSTLTGSAGYSFCEEGNTSAPCPFYLGSFDALAAADITASVECSDNTQTRVTVSDLVVKLSQPAFGIAEAGSNMKGFPTGGLVFETSFDVGTEHVTARRPSAEAAFIETNGAVFVAEDLLVTLQVPCNGRQASVTARFTAKSPVTSAPLGRPPVVTNTTAASGACGVARTLSATVTDPDSDAGALRWRVDGVLMAPSTTSIMVTGSHTVGAFVRDSRGATSTEEKVISCL